MNHYQDWTDLALMSLLAEDDKLAYEEIYERYKAPLYLHAYRMLHSVEEAQDVLHDIFVSLWCKRHDIVLETALAPYLYRAVRHRVLNVISRKKIQNRYLDSIESFLEQGCCETELQIRENELVEIIEREIALLPPKMRKVFELSRKRNLSYHEIANTLGIADNTVKKQVHKALTILRDKLDGSLALLLLWI
jgi:RNA polymerase sigma-70 factor (ECF subfamily)